MFQMRMTPTLKKSIIDCSRSRGVNYTEWARGVLADAVMKQSLRPTPQQEQDQKGETQ
jgi:hypothetical protein